MCPSSPPTIRSWLSGNMESDTNAVLSLAPFALSSCTETRLPSLGSCSHSDFSGFSGLI